MNLNSWQSDGARSGEYGGGAKCTSLALWFFLVRIFSYMRVGHCHAGGALTTVSAAFSVLLPWVYWVDLRKWQRWLCSPAEAAHSRALLSCLRSRTPQPRFFLNNSVSIAKRENRRCMVWTIKLLLLNALVVADYRRRWSAAAPFVECNSSELIF